VSNPSEVRKVAEKVLNRLPGARVIAREEMQRTYEAAFNWRQGVLLTFLSTILIAFALLAWDKASGLSAEERREIGILKAVGWDTGDVLRMKLWEGALLSITAFLSGYVLAWLHVFYCRRAAVHRRVEGLVGAVSALRAGAADRRGADRHAVLPHRAALCRRHHRAGLARGDAGPGRSDAGVRPLETSS
jgi:cell division protein FtsX